MASDKFDFGEFLAVLETKRAALDTLIDSYRAALSVGALGGDVTVELSGVGATTAVGNMKAGGSIELPQGALLRKSIPDAIKLLLSAARRKLTTREIAIGLKDGGVESTSKFFENTVTTALHRLKASGEVLKFSDGWALAEFYPESLRSRLAAQGEPKATKKIAKARRKRAAKKQARVVSMPTAEEPKAAAG